MIYYNLNVSKLKYTCIIKGEITKIPKLHVKIFFVAKKLAPITLNAQKLNQYCLVVIAMKINAGDNLTAEIVYCRKFPYLQQLGLS